LTVLRPGIMAWFRAMANTPWRPWRESSDFLAYRNHAGLYADFHSCRHLFTTSLERVGIRPKLAQTLARHSDVRLTLGVYTHVDLSDQTAAIATLPGPPGE
jgi:integrase